MLADLKGFLKDLVFQRLICPAVVAGPGSVVVAPGTPTLAPLLRQHPPRSKHLDPLTSAIGTAD